MEATIASQAETIRQLQEEQERVRARKQAAKNERYWQLELFICMYVLIFILYCVYTVYLGKKLR